jgi:hypothetical protein
MGGFGEYIYDNTGAVIKHNSPNFAGFSKSKDLKTGQTSQSYNAGPLSVKQASDGSTEAEYDLGIEKVKMNQGGTATVNSGRMDEFAYVTGLAKRVSGTDAKVTKSAAKDVFDIKRLAGL